MSQQEPLIGGVQKAEAEAMEQKKPIKAIPINIINAAGSSGKPPLKKRGRPRKYGPNAKPLAPVAPAAPDAAAPVSPAAAPVSPTDPDSATPVAPAAPAAPATPAPPPVAAPAAAAASGDPAKKRRGRPRGSSNKNGLKGKGPAEASMVPHVIVVKTGEDLSVKLMSLALNGPRNICILAASGEISNITLRKPDTSAGVVTYEGRFEIITLGGSFLFSESGDSSGGINVSLSYPDGRLMGGAVAGQVIAASPIQVVVASFGGEHCRD